MNGVTYIYLFGAQNGGKSTQMKHIGDTLNAMGYKTLVGFQLPERTDGSIARRSASKGFQINEVSNYESQYHVCMSYSLFDTETRKKAQNEGYQFAVFDRTILDHLLYALRVDTISVEDKTEIANYALSHARRNPADYAYLCEPIPKMEADGMRSVNKDFQDEMHSRFMEYIIGGKIGQRVIRDYFKHLDTLPYVEGFSKEESLRLRTEKVIDRLRADGRLV